jgi:hypothetical protein
MRQWQCSHAALRGTFWLHKTGVLAPSTDNNGPGCAVEQQDHAIFLEEQIYPGVLRIRSGLGREEAAGLSQDT